MPYTLSHPLAVVPLRRWCPGCFNFAALVIGSMSPDFGYFTNMFDAAKYAHSWQGMFVVCLPASLVLLGLFYLLRRPLCFILPQPSRAALAPLTLVRPDVSIRGLVVASWSVLLGAVTHILWDSLTHYYGWLAQHFEFWRRPLFSILGTWVPPYFLLQLFSSIVGGAGLIVLYLLWLERQPNKAINESDTDRWRYLLLAGAVVVSIAVGLAGAYYHTLPFTNGPTFNQIVYWTIVYSTSVFFPLLALSSVAAYATKGTGRA